MQTVNITCLDSTKLTLGTLGLSRTITTPAVIDQTQSTEGIEVMEEVEKNVAVGDEIVGAGKQQGRRRGDGNSREKSWASAPHRIEISAAFRQREQR